jgi:hypothetical protein
MATPPTLLDQDGRASMATALMMSHHGFRRDIARFALALGAPGSAPARAAALNQEWQRYRNTIHGHHHSEDTGIFPSLRAEHAALAGVLDQLSADHRRIDPLLEEGDRAFAGLPARAAAGAAVVAQLSALLDPHLALEEERIIPHLRAARQFPAPANDAEAALYAQGFAWASHGIAPEVLAALDAMLPPVLAAKLPAARAAFELRCTRVWGPTKPGASRTPIPDWLPGG